MGLVVNSKVAVLKRGCNVEPALHLFFQKTSARQVVRV